MSTRTSLDSLAAELDSTPDPFPIIQRFHLAEQSGDEFIMRECASQLSMIEYLMAQTPEGALKQAAWRIGIDPAEYFARIACGEKWCTKCKAWHSRAIFHSDRSRGDGLAASCRNYKVPPRVYPRTRDQLNTAYRAYYAGEGGPRIRATKTARKRQCEPISPRDRELVLESFFGLCAYCGETATTIDHVIPISKGGSSKRGNLLPACYSCNSRKNTKSLEEFLLTAKNPSDRIIDELCMGDIL